MGFFGKIGNAFKKAKDIQKQAQLKQLALSKKIRSKLTSRFKFLDRVDKFEKRMKRKGRKLKKRLLSSIFGKKPKTSKQTRPASDAIRKKIETENKSGSGRRIASVNGSKGYSKSKYVNENGVVDSEGHDKRTEDALKNLGSRHDYLKKIVEKADFIAMVKEDVREMLEGQSSAIVQIDEFVKDININRNRMGFYSNEELEKFDDMMNMILDEMGIDITDFDAKAQNDRFKENKDEYYDFIKKVSFDTYMDNWKTKFFGSDEIIADGVVLDDEGKVNLWRDIENSKSQAWFDEYKARKLNE